MAEHVRGGCKVLHITTLLHVFATPLRKMLQLATVIETPDSHLIVCREKNTSGTLSASGLLFLTWSV
jgi:hypothetical protein